MTYAYVPHLEEVPCESGRRMIRPSDPARIGGCPSPAATVSTYDGETYLLCLGHHSRHREAISKIQDSPAHAG